MTALTTSEKQMLSADSKSYGAGEYETNLSRTDSGNNRGSTQVVGTTNLYENGQLRYIPMPSPDPKGMCQTSNQTKQTLINGPTQILLISRTGTK